MGPDASADHGFRPAGEVARDRLLALLTDAASSALVVGLVDGVGADRPPAAGGAARGPTSFLQRECELAVPEVGVSGAGVTVMGSVDDGIAGRRDQLASVGGMSRRLEDLQLTAGEGPCLDAFAAGAPVLVGDLEKDASRWPGFAPEALLAGVAAVFSLPLQIGAVRLGTFDLYRDAAGPLSATRLATAVMLAGLVTETLLEHAGGGVDDGGPPGAGAGRGDAGWLADVHAGVHQASGIVSVTEQLDVGEAMVRIRAFAYSRGQAIGEVADRIIAGDLVLSDVDR